jgi:hypothetical protein
MADQATYATASNQMPIIDTPGTTTSDSPESIMLRDINEYTPRTAFPWMYESMEKLVEPERHEPSLADVQDTLRGLHEQIAVLRFNFNIRQANISRQEMKQLQTRLSELETELRQVEEIPALKEGGGRDISLEL